MTAPNGVWCSLLDIIEDANKLVELDLSECGLQGTEFNPDSSVLIGKDKIVSLALPDMAISIKAGSLDEPAFINFSNLKACSGANIINIGNCAFYTCSSLETVEFPVVKDFGAFAFLECTALESVSFPLAQSIDFAAFSHCTALVSVEFPMAQSIGGAAFSSTGSEALTIYMGDTAPSLGSGLFNGVSSKSVTVKIPEGAAGYGTIPFNNADTTAENWGNAFRGMGWDGTNYLGEPVKENIILTIEEY